MRDQMENDGGPAFPRTKERHGLYGEDLNVPGMSLRDWFAGHIIQVLIMRCPHILDEAQLSKDAYEVADAMLLARDQE